MLSPVARHRFCNPSPIFVTRHLSPRAEQAMAEDSSKEMFEFFQKMWNPMSFPIPGMFQPTMDVEEIEKKIRELQSVENWLKMNLGFLQMTVQTLEMQKSALTTLQESAKAVDPKKSRGGKSQA
jgi:hypothetical protein